MPRPVTPHRSAASGPIRRLAGLTILAALLASPALSQQPDAATPPPDDAGGTRPPVQQPGQPAAQPAPLEPLPEVEVPEETAPDEGQQPQRKGAGLPPDFTPPPAEIPEVMTLRKPLMTDEEIATEERELSRFNRQGINTILHVGDPSPQNKEAIRRWARLQVAKMTAVKEWREASNITRSEILLKARNAAITQQNASREREFREAVCAALTAACREVLDNNFHVRMQAATILSQLDVVAEEMVGQNRRPPVTYVPAMEPLLDVIADEAQPPAVKIRAAAGVGRLAEYAELIPAELKFRAGDVLTKELAKKDTHYWYQMRLAEALAAVELDFNNQRQPIVIEGLLAVIADESRHCVARSAAAKALGRTPIPAGAFNDKAAADRLVQLARDMSLNYNKEPGQVHWYDCYANLYLAFRPADQDEVSRLPANSLLRRGSLPPALDDAARRITPVVAHVLNQKPGAKHQPIPTELIQRLNEFLAVAGQ